MEGEAALLHKHPEIALRGHYRDYKLVVVGAVRKRRHDPFLTHLGIQRWRHAFAGLDPSARLCGLNQAAINRLNARFLLVVDAVRSNRMTRTAATPLQAWTRDAVMRLLPYVPGSGLAMKLAMRSVRRASRAIVLPEDYAAPALPLI